MSFAVRSLPSTTGLDGAFRVHVLPEHLEQAGLKLGDLCEITGEDGTAVGYGVSWRATDKMGTNPKVRPAKMTEVLRTAYAIRDGSHVMLYQTEAKVVHAEKVFLTDVTPGEYMAGHEEDFEDGKWRTRCAMVLCELHLIDDNEVSF
jgi:AAA family ATPase